LASTQKGDTTIKFAATDGSTSEGVDRVMFKDGNQASRFQDSPQLLYEMALK
jgi:uncharacterized protein YcnI